ncbi:MAG: hypothetical protein AB7U45_08135 [Desulfamplus sp.]
MLSDEIGKELHERATQGKILTNEEHKLLQEWYNVQDRAESECLYSNAVVETEHTIQKQINNIIIKIEAASENIHKLTSENILLKKNIAAINKKLSEKIMAHTI